MPENKLILSESFSFTSSNILMIINSDLAFSVLIDRAKGTFLFKVFSK